MIFIILLLFSIQNTKKEETRLLKIGWKHRTSSSCKFVQMKEPTGGLKNIELNINKSYSCKEIKDLAVEEMKSKRNVFYFTDATIELGNYNNDIFKEFKDDSGKECDFWKFCPKIRQKNRRIKLYILTTEKDELQSDSKDKLEEEEESRQENLHKTKPEASLVRLPLQNIGTKEVTNKLNIGSKKLDRDEEKIKELQNQRTSPKARTSGYSKTSHVSDIVDDSNMSQLQTIKRKHEMSFESKKENFTPVSSVVYGMQYRLDSEKKIKIVMPTYDSYVRPEKSLFHNIKLSVPVINTDDIILLSKCLGQGGFGTVNLGSWLGTEVAVKRIKLGNNDKYIIREVQMMDRIRHPNVISLMAVGQNAADVYIVMEHFKSCNLRRLLTNGKIDSKYRLMEDTKNNILLQVCKAISFLHDLSPPILHKDVKPENILVNVYSETKLCDLGLSRSENLPEHLLTTVGNNVKGTYHYMAPELLRLNESATVKADIWSLACVIFEVYSEEEAWEKHLETTAGSDEIMKFKHIYELNKKPDLSRVPHPLRCILRSCFDQNIHKRPKASTLLDIIQSLQD